MSANIWTSLSKSNLPDCFRRCLRTETNLIAVSLVKLVSYRACNNVEQICWSSSPWNLRWLSRHKRLVCRRPYWNCLGVELIQKIQPMRFNSAYRSYKRHKTVKVTSYQNCRPSKQQMGPRYEIGCLTCQIPSPLGQTGSYCRYQSNQSLGKPRQYRRWRNKTALRRGLLVWKSRDKSCPLKMTQMAKFKSQRIKKLKKFSQHQKAIPSHYLRRSHTKYLHRHRSQRGVGPVRDTYGRNHKLILGWATVLLSQITAIRLWLKQIIYNNNKNKSIIRPFPKSWIPWCNALVAALLTSVELMGSLLRQIRAFRIMWRAVWSQKLTHLGNPWSNRTKMQTGRHSANWTLSCQVIKENLISHSWIKEIIAWRVVQKKWRKESNSRRRFHSHHLPSSRWRCNPTTFRNQVQPIERCWTSKWWPATMVTIRTW